jgi:archaellum component FlaC
VNEEHIAEILDLERRKLAIQVAAYEVRMDDKIKASEKRIIDAVTNAIAPLAVDLEGVKLDVAELKTDVSELKTDVSELKTNVSELKTNVHRILELVEQRS